MTGRLLQTVIRRAESLAAEMGDRGPDAVPDSDLLARFAADRDEPAFAALINRHGPMVWAVCRHLLLDPTDAEDAFQATFLALVRSARSLPSGAAVGGWLHGVAVRSAAQLRRSAARRRRREERAARPEAGQPVPDAAWDALVVALHEEVQLLPEALRTAFVLCDLEGVRQPDAAARLGWKLGTLSGRLTKARQRLIGRLADRGIAPGLASGTLVVGAAAAGGAVPVGLAMQTIGLSVAAADAVPPALSKLVLEVMPMTVNRTKLIAACVVLAGGLAAGLGPVLIATADAQPPAAGEPGSLAPPAGPGGGFPGAPGTPAGPAGFPGVGGPPGAGVGGPMMPGSMSGMGAPGEIGRARWEHELVDKPRSTQEFASLLQRYGDKGWEFAGVVDFGGARSDSGGPGGGLRPSPASTSVVVFKRPVRPVTGGGGAGQRYGPPMGGTPSSPGPGAGDPFSPNSSPRRGAGSSGMGPQPGMSEPGMSSGGPAGVGAAGAGFQVLALKNAVAQDMAAMLRQLFGNIQVVSDARTNSIILKADPVTEREIEALIRRLDVPGADDASGTSGAGGAGGTSPRPPGGRP